VRVLRGSGLIILFKKEMLNELAVPAGLAECPHFCKKIKEQNELAFAHVEYLRDLVTNIHQVYNQLCKSLVQASEDHERKIVNECKSKNEHSEAVLEFVKGISFLHITISNQLNCNSVTLGIKTHRIAQNRLEVLGERLDQCHRVNKDYLRTV
jgi:limonene-1,2-epoxide hydrolase